MTFDHYTLRPPEIADAEALYKLVSDNKIRLADYFPPTVSFITDIASARVYINEKTKEAEAKQVFTFAIVDTQTSVLIGMIFIKKIDWTIPKAELAYYIGKNYEGQGITTRAIGLIVSYCFDTLDMNKLFLRTATDNKGSQQVAIKNGFRLEGTLRKDFKIADATLIDLYQYGLVRGDINIIS